MEETGDILFDVMKKMSIDNIKKVMNSATEEISFQAKKEVFDDIGKYRAITGCILINETAFNQLKKKHIKKD